MTNSILAFEVIAVYSKTGGKNGKHSAIMESSTIAAVSYLGVQLFQYYRLSQQFRSVTDATAIFQTKQFLLLPSIQFLCLLETRLPPEQSSAPFIELLPGDIDRYKALKNGQKEITAALKLSKKRGGGEESDD